MFCLSQLTSLYISLAWRMKTVNMFIRVYSVDLEGSRSLRSLQLMSDSALKRVKNDHHSVPNPHLNSSFSKSASSHTSVWVSGSHSRRWWKGSSGDEHQWSKQKRVVPCHLSPHIQIFNTADIGTPERQFPVQRTQFPVRRKTEHQPESTSRAWGLRGPFQHFTSRQIKLQ